MRIYFIILIISIVCLLFYLNKNQLDINNNFNYIYKNNFLDKNDFIKLTNELKIYDKQLNNSKQTLNNLSRYNLELTSPNIYNIIKKYESKIKKLTKNSKIYLANNFPIEYRKYVKGDFMNKHRDLLLYKIPQYECVLTLSNTTDSVTDIEDYKISAKPNSLIILRANGAEHKVTMVTKGERKFLKFIFTETDEFI